MISTSIFLLPQRLKQISGFLSLARPQLTVDDVADQFLSENNRTTAKMTIGDTGVNSVVHTF